MRTTDPRAKEQPKENRPDSTGKVYEQLVEDLFMGSSSDEDEDQDNAE